MKSQIIINILSVEYGRTRNYLLFKCTYSRDPINTHEITFCWSDIYTDMSLSDEDQETLRNMLKEDYHPPFDIDKTKQILTTKYQYCIEK